MNELQKIFNYQDQQVRTVVKDGQPWFVAKDVCNVLNLGLIALHSTTLRSEVLISTILGRLK